MTFILRQKSKIKGEIFIISGVLQPSTRDGVGGTVGLFLGNMALALQDAACQDFCFPPLSMHIKHQAVWLPNPTVPCRMQDSNDLGQR